ncbi:MAG TPA: BON domain-containing protein [Cyclobacteriaceae bacterium]
MDRSEKTRRRRNANNRFAGDYYYNSNQPNWVERDEELHRHNYGLPASGITGRRRHDFSEWGNSNFTYTGSPRGYGRVNDRRRSFESDHIPEDQNPVRGRNYHGREYDYNRFGMGDGGTWNQRGDESYDFGEHNQRRSSHYSSDLANHRGKGPKGFTRTDERIKEDINCRLTDDAYVDASNIEIGVENSEVTMTGTVPDRSSKRRAEDIAELVSGVSNVENRLRVK